MAVVAIVVLGLAVAVLATSLLRLRNRFEPLEKLIEEMEKVDLGRPGAALPHSIDGIGETEEVERLELAFLRMMRRLEAERRRAGSAALQAQEQERARVARDLHDEVNQSLTGLQATREIKQQAPEVSVLILSMHDDERYLFEALKAGASGYVLKAQADTDLLAAIRAVERGEPFLTPAAQRTLIKDVLERGGGSEEELTPREEEIVKLVAEAHTTREIAELLHLSEKTVENHRANAMRKLGMRDRVELTRYAIRAGLIEP